MHFAASLLDYQHNVIMLSVAHVLIREITTVPNLSLRQQMTGDIAGAKALYHRALSLRPDSPELLTNVGFLEEQSGGGSRTSREKAAALYARALELLDAGSPVRGQVEINLKNVRKGLMMGDVAERTDE